MHKPEGSETKRIVTMSIVLCTAIALLAVAGCEQWARMEDNQIKVQAMVAANARQLATISSQLHTGHGKLNESLQNLDQDTQEVAGGVLVVQNEQRQLQDALVAGNAQLNAKITQLETNQHSLQGSLTQVVDVTGRTASDLTALAGEHTALHETVRANQQEVTKSLSAVADGQQRIQTGVTHLQQADEGLASDIATLADKQNAMHTAMEQNQQSLRSAVDGVAGTTNRTAADVTGLAAGQSAMQETLRINREVLTGQMAAGLQNQQAMQNQLNALTATTSQTTLDIAALDNGQAGLQRDIKAGNEMLAAQVSALTENQQALRAGISDLAGKTDRVSAGLAAMAAGQEALQRTLVDRSDEIETHVALLAERQETFATNLDILMATAGQTALDILTLADGQADLQRSVKTGDEALTARMTTVARNQQALKSGVDTLGELTQQVNTGVATMAAVQNTLNQTLQTHNSEIGERVASLASSHTTLGSQLDILTATTGQASLDVLALANGQTQLGQAVQVNRQELTTGLAAVAQNQQNWLRQFETTQATAQAVAENLAALEGRLANLQAVVQTSAQDVTARLGTDGQQRRQFEAQVGQDIQAMFDAIAQLRQVQAALQEQMTQVQKSTESQAQNIKAAIEQMQGTPNTNNRVRSSEQPPAELKVSDAGKNVEAPVAQSAE